MRGMAHTRPAGTGFFPLQQPPEEAPQSLLFFSRRGVHVSDSRNGIAVLKLLSAPSVKLSRRGRHGYQEKCSHFIRGGGATAPTARALETSAGSEENAGAVTISGAISGRRHHGRHGHG